MVSVKKIFSCFFHVFTIYIKLATHVRGVGGPYLNKLGGGPPGDATYQISRL